jgi:hypothetical protein
LALSDENVDALYILSDGMPDDSIQFVLSETARLLQGREKVKVGAFIIIIVYISDSHDFIQL